MAKTKSPRVKPASKPAADKPKRKKAEKPKQNTGNMKAIKKEVDGIIFASTMEADYYEYLKAERDAGRVIKFDLQPVFPLLESFKKYGKTILGIKYISDFRVWYADGSMKIIDVKGRETDDFKLKRKLFDDKYPDLYLQLVIWDPKAGVWADYDEHKKAKSKAKREKKKAQKIIASKEA